MGNHACRAPIAVLDVADERRPEDFLNEIDLLTGKVVVPDET